jgi:hypothetical protein
MARSFTSNFSTCANAPAVKPYFILKIDWLKSYDHTSLLPQFETIYYLDRPPTSFDATGQRIPNATIGQSYVVDWGSFHLTLREQQIGAIDEITIKVQDFNSQIRDRLNAYVQQRQTATIYRMFDDPSCVWPTDAAKVFVGTLKSFTFNESDGTVTLPIQDFSTQLLRTVECRATKDTFQLIPDDERDKNIPLVWGSAHRVPTVLLQRPPTTKIIEVIEMDATLPLTVKVDQHPDEIGADVNATVHGDNYYSVGSSHTKQFYLGTDIVTGYFTASTDPDNTPSTFTITELTRSVCWTGVVSAITSESWTIAGVTTTRA